MTCDIVIPAHNEERTISMVVRACKDAGVGKVIVVCDSCSDNTASEAGMADVVVSITAQNKGTGMATGISYVTTDDVLFCDADLSGLSPAVVEALSTALPTGGQVVGLTESMINKWSKFGLPPITGERRLPTAFARTIPMTGQGYKVELVIDAAVGRAKMPHAAYVMAGVTNPTRMYEDPVGWSAMWADLGVVSLRYLPDLARYTLG